MFSSEEMPTGPVDIRQSFGTGNTPFYAKLFAKLREGALVPVDAICRHNFSETGSGHC
jgi:hypothetical protein